MEAQGEELDRLLTSDCMLKGRACVYVRVCVKNGGKHHMVIQQCMSLGDRFRARFRFRTKGSMYTAVFEACSVLMR